MVRSPIFEGRSAEWQTWLHISRRVRIWRRTLTPLGTVSFLLTLLVVSAVAALVGGVLARRMFVADAPPTTVVSTGHQAEAGGLLLQVAAITWLVSAPAEGSRLRVDFRLQNPTDRTHAIGPQEFHLDAQDGASWPASADSISATTLGPKQTLTGTLLFDVPASVLGLQLVWSTSRHEVRVPIAGGAFRYNQPPAADRTQ